MIEGDTGGPRMRQKAVIINRIRPGLHLLKDVRRHDRALHDLPRDLHAGDMYAAILVRGQIIRLDHWFCHRVRAGDMNESAAFRAKLARPEGDPGEIVELPLFRIGKAGIGDVVLDIRPGQTFAAPHKTAKHAGRHRQHPAAGKQIAQNLAGKGIRVNGVAPGPIWTPLHPCGGAREETLEHFGESTPMGRPGQPNEVAPSFLFLACEDASYMTGQVLHPNGGIIVGS